MIVALAGMHRSGTSMFASYLHTSGVAMGDALYEDRRTNPYGHYEDLDFLGLQRRELARAFGGEDYLVAAPFTPSPGFVDGARRLLAAKRARYGAAPWGWKDPRTTLFLETWAALAPELRVVGMLRPPRQVASSLCARLGAYLSPRRIDHFLAVHAHYNRELLAFLERHPERTSVVALERLLADPKGVLDRLGAALTLPLDAAAFRATYDPEVMSKVRPAVLALNRRARRAAEATYRALLERSL